MGIVNENIRKYRKFRGLSQQALAKKVSRATNVVSNWENDVHSPDLDTIVLICEALDITPNQLFGWEVSEEYKEWEHEMKVLEDFRNDLNRRVLEYHERMNNLQNKREK